MNAKNIINAFNAEVQSFNAAVRFIFETSKTTAVNVPAAPAKEDKSEEAKNARKNIKNAENVNAVISDCKNIVDAFGITAADLKGKAIKSLREKIMQHAPAVDAEGRAVKFVKLPAYLKDEINSYSEVFAVVPASWIETIIASAENVDGEQKTGYNVTAAPVVAEGELTESAAGDVVNAKGEKVESSAIFAKWDKVATYRNISNAEGRAVASATYNELKSKNA